MQTAEEPRHAIKFSYKNTPDHAPYLGITVLWVLFTMTIENCP